VFIFQIGKLLNKQSQCIQNKSDEDGDIAQFYADVQQTSNKSWLGVFKLIFKSF